MTTERDIIFGVPIGMLLGALILAVILGSWLAVACFLVSMILLIILEVS